MMYHKWTNDEDQFLKDNYEWIGDSYLADLFNNNFPKSYLWTKKHVEKRRSYLKFKRTKEQQYILRLLNGLSANQYKSWDKRGRSIDGDIRIWYSGRRRFIKCDGKFIDMNRYSFELSNGKIPKDHVIRNGKLIHRADNAVINSTQRNGKIYPMTLIETKILSFKLKRLINGKEN